MTIATPEIPTGTASRVRWVLIDSWTITQRAFAHWARNPGVVIFTLLFNVLIVLLFNYLIGGAIMVPGGGKYIDFLMPGMFTMTMLFGIAQTTIAVTTDVDRGVTDRFRSMPMSSAAVLIGRVTADMVFSVVNLAVMVVAGLAIGWRANGTAAEFWAAIGLVLLLRFALIWVGVYLGLVLHGEATTSAQTLEFPIGFLSSAFVSPDTMPNWLGAIAEWNPLSSTVTATRDLFDNPGVGDSGSWVVEHALPMAIVWPVALTLIFFPLSVWSYRNLSR
ncbi:ABC transporter permease [Nocardia wallacei]|uniref:ABC transporter permease n=1 Tax=Nocardia wallacei TaxID=480035 RepID=UPI002458E824|nr:ABC transporter permease [Nocardia wallacei]